MRPVRPRDATPQAGLTACLASLLELEGTGDEIPATRAAWEDWLAARNLALVQPAEPPTRGFWIAQHARPGGERSVLMFGTPPGVVWDPDPDRPVPAGPPDRALMLAALDPVLPTGLPAAAPRAAGLVEGLFVAPIAGTPARALTVAEAVPGRGLRGDRYFAGTGHFSSAGRSGQDVTLVEAEALEELPFALAPAEARRNVVTRGIDLNALAGRRFQVGAVTCLGRRWCEPCARLEQLTRPGVLRGLVHRGGLRADVLTAGEIRTGDGVRA